MIEKLLQYQEVDASLKAIENDLKKSDEFKKYARAVMFLKTVAESKAQIEAKATSLVAAMDGLEARLNALENEKKEFENTDDAKKEETFAFLKKKSQELSARFGPIEEELDALLKEMNALADQYKDLMDKTRNMLSQQDEYKAKYEALSATRDAEKAKIRKELEKIAKDIPEEYMKKYKEKRKDPKFPIVYELGDNDKHCPACGTELSQLELSRLKTEKMIECENCRRLIFIKK